MEWVWSLFELDSNKKWMKIRFERGNKNQVPEKQPSLEKLKRIELTKPGYVWREQEKSWSEDSTANFYCFLLQELFCFYIVRALPANFRSIILKSKSATLCRALKKISSELKWSFSTFFRLPPEIFCDGSIAIEKQLYWDKENCSLARYLIAMAAMMLAA